MVTESDVTFLDMLRSLPVLCLCVTAIPLGVGMIQLANSYVNELSFLVSGPFALVMTLFAVVAIQHQFAQFRRRQFERALDEPTTD